MLILWLVNCKCWYSVFTYSFVCISTAVDDIQSQHAKNASDVELFAFSIYTLPHFVFLLDTLSTETMSIQYECSVICTNHNVFAHCSTLQRKNESKKKQQCAADITKREVCVAMKQWLVVCSVCFKLISLHSIHNSLFTILDSRFSWNDVRPQPMNLDGMASHMTNATQVKRSLPFYSICNTKCGRCMST